MLWTSSRRQGWGGGAADGIMDKEARDDFSYQGSALGYLVFFLCACSRQVLDTHTHTHTIHHTLRHTRICWALPWLVDVSASAFFFILGWRVGIIQGDAAQPNGTIGDQLQGRWHAWNGHTRRAISMMPRLDHVHVIAATIHTMHAKRAMQLLCRSVSIKRWRL